MAKMEIVTLVGCALALLALVVAEAPAQTSCQGMFTQCAVRCKERAPSDKNCVSDHCSPKLAECKQSGCWQEGKQYGGQRSCNLRKG